MKSNSGDGHTQLKKNRPWGQLQLREKTNGTTQQNDEKLLIRKKKKASPQRQYCKRPAILKPEKCSQQGSRGKIFGSIIEKSIGEGGEGTRKKRKNAKHSVKKLCGTAQNYRHSWHSATHQGEISAFTVSREGTKARLIAGRSKPEKPASTKKLETGEETTEPSTGGDDS